MILDFKSNNQKNPRMHNSILLKKWSFHGVFLYLFLLYWLYLYIYRTIGPLFRYMYNFQTQEVSLEFYVLAGVYFLTISLFTYQQYIRASLSDYFIITLTLLYFLPGITMLIHGNWSISYCLFHFFSYFSLALTNEFIPRSSSIIITNKLGSKRLISLFSKVISISVVGIIIHYYGFHITIDFTDVYTLREEWSNSNMPNIFNYYLPFATRITPILFLISFKEKKYLDVGLLILSQLLSFSFGGMKYTLFALILAIIFHFTSKNITKNRFLLFYLGLCVLSALEILIENHTGKPFLATFLQRRMSFIPNQIGYYYFEFFQKENYLLYSESIMRWALDYPYPQNMPHTIATYAFDRPEMGANTGLYAEGFSQIGLLVLPIYSILYIVIFRIYSYCFSNIYAKYGLYIPLLGIILYTATFTDGALFSVLATQGFLLFILVAFLISKNIGNVRKREI